MKQPKILAIYLPQFYQTPDNDRWWGSGFTDWETVKTAKSYYENHMQPKVPYNKNYYDLSDVEAIRQQAKIAKKYGVDGFCLYHYYFKDGKRELDLPEKLILENRDIDITYCLNWASESWIRSWSRIQGNVWSERYDNSGSGDIDGVLVRQDYGNEEIWRKHFEELLPHFLDDRYICVEGKPVFIFYSPDDIPCLEEMVACWRLLAIENGLKGLYIIGARMRGGNKCLDAALIYEPRHSINELNYNGEVIIKNGARCYDYSRFWDEILSSKSVYDMKTYFSGAVDYDDTPRRGDKGECLIDVDLNIFRKGISNLIAKSIAYENDFLFINAWNEWGEGMYLEPDENRGFAMLKVIQEAKNLVDDSMLDRYKRQKELIDKSDINPIIYEAKKFKELFEVLDKWFFLEQENNFSIKKYLNSKGYNSFAIYGMASMGKHLLIQARKEGFNPDFGIDRYVGMFGNDFRIYRPEEEFPEVDCIIVTAYDYFEIKKKIQNKTDATIVYIGDVINKIYQ